MINHLNLKQGENMLKKIAQHIYMTLLALVIVGAMFSALGGPTSFAQVDPPTPPGGGEGGGGSSSGTCCTYSSQCPGTLLCKIPPPDLAPCSRLQKNYCMPY